MNWIRENIGNGKHPLIILDNLSNLVELGDDNSAGQMQSFNMIVTKARKYDCSLVIVHHTGKQMTIGPDGVPTWRGSYDMATRLDKTICLMPCDSSLDGFVTFQILEGKSRRGDRLKMSVQFNPFEKKWEIFDPSSTEDRNELTFDLLRACCVARYEDLSDIIDRSPSSAERYIKQAIDSEVFKETEWKSWKREAKKSDRDDRICKGKELMEENYNVLINEKGRGGRFVVEKVGNYFRSKDF